MTRSVFSLFTGAGGLDLGFQAAGFETRLGLEKDPDAVATINANRPWTIIEDDVHAVDVDHLLIQAGFSEVDVLIAGPPCTPFSKASHWSGGGRGLDDPRADTLMATMEVIARTLPKVVLLENVPGLASQGGEGLALLQRRFHEINQQQGTHYDPVFTKLNAADYGVPQTRTRLFLVAARNGAPFSFPAPTHGDPEVELGHLAPYRTAWDAIGDLEHDGDPALTLRGKWADLVPSIPAGQNYQFHTVRGGGIPLFEPRSRYWNFLLKLSKSRPSWTLVASPGPATGPIHWHNRYLSIRELCRLQTIPDGYQIMGSANAQRRQVGNAVPAALAEMLASAIASQLLTPTLAPSRTTPPPDPEPVPVPDAYLGGRRPPIAYEIFAGAGGLALGIKEAGFQHTALVDADPASCKLLRRNLDALASNDDEPEIHELDVRKMDRQQQEITLIAGGPPCQPFSAGGVHLGPDDDRDLFPEAARAIAMSAPRAFILENVPGLLRSAFADYFRYILLRLRFPEQRIQKGQDWTDHLQRLSEQQSGQGLQYDVSYQTVNAADYGVPQIRKRVFIVGFRSDLNLTEWQMPPPTHSRSALMREKWITRAYWEGHSIAASCRPAPTLQETQATARLATEDVGGSLPWRTVRDAISDLPEPGESDDDAHRFRGGARAYPGHTGSPLDLPSKTLKSGVHGTPGGENMMVDLDGSLRYFTLREAARLQTFPDSYDLDDLHWTTGIRLLGNAVPPRLAAVVSQSVAALLR